MILAMPFMLSDSFRDSVHKIGEGLGPGNEDIVLYIDRNALYVLAVQNERK